MRRRKLAAALAALLALTTAGARGETITLSLVGDCAIADQYCYRGRPTSLTARVEKDGYDWPFSGAAEWLLEDDLTIANCEGVLTERKPGRDAKAMSLSAPPALAQVFVEGGVDVVNLANNHSRDFGDGGLEDTWQALDDAGIVHFGVGKPAIVEVKGVKIGFCGYCYPITDAKMRYYREAIRELREAGCALVIASIHSGKEDCATPNREQLTRCPELIDMGADIVYGHGAHVLQPIRYYKDRLIMYGLGNFVFGANPRPNDDDTAVIRLTYELRPDGAPVLSRLEALPMKVHMDGDFRPYPIADEEGQKRVFAKLMFSGKKLPMSNLDDNFSETGMMNFQLPSL